jgi:hypothetical protein
MRFSRAIASLGLLLAMSHPAFGAGCQSFVGNWYWFTGYIVTLKADHTIVHDGKPVGNWSCTSASKPAATLRWDSKFVDTITIKDGGIVGVNQAGYKIWANRSTPATAADDQLPPNLRPKPSVRPPAPPAPPSRGCVGGNWRQQCEQQLKNDPIQGPYPSQGAINSCIQDKMSACGNLVP